MSAMCLHCRRSDQGPLSYAYLAWYQGQTRVGQRLKLCSTCWIEVLETAVLCAETSDSSGRWWTEEERGDLSPLAVAESSAARTTSAALSSRTTKSAQKRRPKSATN